MSEPKATLRDLVEIGIPEALLREFSELPNRHDFVAYAEAIMSSIIAFNERDMIKALHNVATPINPHHMALIQGRISLAKKLRIAFVSSLDMLDPTESGTSASQTQEQK